MRVGAENIKTVYLIRHGETHANERHEIQGWRDTQLSEEGVAQAWAVAYALIRYPLFSISSSDLSRAVTTANIIGNRIGARRDRLPDLRDRGYGIWEGKQIKDLEKTFGKEWYLNLPLRGEDHSTFSERVTRGFNTALERAAHLGGNIAIVSHGGTIQEIFKQLGRETQGMGYEIPNGSITTLIGPGNGTLKDFKLGSTTVPRPTELRR